MTKELSQQVPFISMPEKDYNLILQKLHDVHVKLGHAQQNALGAYFILLRSNPNDITDDLYNKLLQAIKNSLTLSGIDLSSYSSKEIKY